MGGGCVGEETADLKRPLNRPSSSLRRLHGGGTGVGRDTGVFILGRWGTIVQLLLLCWFHLWLRTPVVLQLCTTNTQSRGGHPALVCSVPCLSRDQGLTNDVYAVVLVDICWQNRSPVRHLEWN